MTLPIVTATKRTTLPVAVGVALCALSWLAPLLILIRLIWAPEILDPSVGAVPGTDIRAGA